ncbi:hypothetical protein SAMN05216464_13024 [Mucilaginibacter pineti]|uniref:Uncharacterized protein n=1 Tax=Mucilaginibacter pineti TaxID=1391627 RepID=A0A1G7NY71_9SPHI|nr:hypothetical protein [Mucilaginibacter pineti]SDF78150.1 hypothetical protein SAMN05216464_13024 [Mucilaginibacter pineti]
MAAESFNRKSGLDQKFYQAKPFYGVIIVSLVVGLLLNFVGITPFQGVIYSAILYGMTAPVIIISGKIPAGSPVVTLARSARQALVRPCNGSASAIRLK